MIKRALFIGLTTIDFQFFTDNYPLPNQKIKTEMPLISAGGPAANAAVTYSFLGGNSDFLTCIGNHSFTNIVKSDLTAHSVNILDAINNRDTEPIIAAIITTTCNSERTIFTHHPDKVQFDNLKLVDRLDDYDFIFTDGFYPELSIEICSIAKQKGIPVIFDGGSWKEYLSDLLPFVDIAICSENFIPPGCETTTEIFNFLKAFNISEMAITRGGQSIITPSISIDIETVEAVDSLGAGDIFHGAFCYYFQSETEFNSLLRRASKVATFSTQFKGTRFWMNSFKML